MGKLAVVLAGGGSRGAYQMGVWKALNELKIEYDIVTGASVGALNGAMMAQKSFDQALNMWEALTTPDIVALNLKPEDIDYEKRHWEADVWTRFIRKAMEDNGVDFAPLEGIMRQVVSEEALRKSTVDFGLVTVEYPSMKGLELAKKDIAEGKIIDYLVASAACFPAFKIKEIDDIKYIDGGYHDNLPINLAISMGATEVIAINLDSIGVIKKPKNKDIPVRYISSKWDLGPFLWFEPTLSAKNIRLGYLDTMKSFGKYEGNDYTFFEGETKKNIEQILPFAEPILGSVMRHVSGKEYTQKIAYFRLLKAMHLNPKKAIASSDVIFPAMEIAGKLFELDPTEIYTTEQFNRILLEKFRTVEDLVSDTLQELRKTKALAVADIFEEVRKEGKMNIVSFLYDELKKILDKRSGLSEFWGFAMLAPTEFVAALYLYGIHSKD